MSAKNGFVNPNSSCPHLWLAAKSASLDASWFTCPHCEKPNHHLARTCRACGKQVAFDKVFTGDVLHPSSLPAPLLEPVTLLDTASVGGRRILHLDRAWGLLLVGVEESGLFIYSAADPLATEPLHLLDGESVFATAHAVMGERPAEERPRLLATTPRGVAQITLLPQPEVDWVYQSEADRIPRHAAFVHDGAIIVASSQSLSATEVIYLRAPLRSPSVVSSTTVEHTPGLDIITLPSSDLFFHTQSAGHVCGLDGTVTSHPSAIPLTTNAHAVLADDKIYVPAGGSIAVFQAQSGDFWRLPTELAQPFQCIFDRDDQRLLIADMEGVKSLGALDGQVKWDSRTALGFSFLAGQVPPVRIRDELVIAGSTSLGQSRVQGVTPFGTGDIRVIAELDGAVPLALQPVATGLAVSVSIPGLHARGEVRIVSMR